jgi:hypothetical protein
VNRNDDAGTKRFCHANEGFVVCVSGGLVDSQNDRLWKGEDSDFTPSPWASLLRLQKTDVV